MKHLFVVRHGNYEGHNLTWDGKEDISYIVDAMKSVVSNDSLSHYLVSSHIPRAKQSAKIISDFFGLKKFDLNELLRLKEGRIPSVENLDQINNLVQSVKNDYDIVTLSTHLEVINHYPFHFINSFFEKNVDFKRPFRNQAVHIDLEKRTYGLIPSLNSDKTYFSF